LLHPFEMQVGGALIHGTEHANSRSVFVGQRSRVSLLIFGNVRPKIGMQIGRRQRAVFTVVAPAATRSVTLCSKPTLVTCHHATVVSWILRSRTVLRSSNGGNQNAPQTENGYYNSFHRIFGHGFTKFLAAFYFGGATPSFTSEYCVPVASPRTAVIKTR